ncbi:uncharacterized protein LOC132562525 [Ylistrum balloti]|uniref:uncharacterized protein LOC132562525 n=1 Tax=Ylistrum balloti TaxID=509963 RepID=UPI002905D4F5|nr:uncharacterized protein LOC132562525 [Ylistrum balloti]XP_060083253.1 uncharacterized protein LOC132562525 [Ylistrum balloti]
MDSRRRQPLQVQQLSVQHPLGYGPVGGVTNVVGGIPGVTTIVIGDSQINIGSSGSATVSDTTDKRWRQQTTIPTETRAGCCGLLSACALISLCNSVVAFMISGESQLFAWVFEQIGIADQVKKDLSDWGEHQDQIQLAFTCTRILSVVLASIVLVRFEYRIVAFVSSTVLGISILITSFLDSSLVVLIGFLVGGVAGIASGFLHMCAILPVLEHFDDGIFRALHAVHQGETVGYVVCALMRMATDNSWRSLFRWQLLPMAVAFGSAFALTPAEFHDSTIILRGTNEPAKTKRKLAWNIFKHPALYLLMVCFLFQRIGFGYLDEQAGILLNSSLYLVLFYLAQWLGPIVMFSKRCVAGYLPHVILTAFSLAAGVYTLAVPKVDHSDGLIILFIIIVGVAVATTESLRDVILTAQFLKEQYCLAFGVLYTCSGIGEIIVSATEEGKEADVYGDINLDTFTLNVSGSLIIVSAAFVCAAAVVYSKIGFPRDGDCFIPCCNLRGRFTRLRNEEEVNDGEGILQEEVLPFSDPEDISYGSTPGVVAVQGDAQLQ